MATIICPSCRKKISDVTSMCPLCGFKRGPASEEQLQELQRRRLRDHVYRLKMASYGAIALLLVAFGWYWWGSSGFRLLPSAGPLALLGLSAVAYLVIRIMLYSARRRLKRHTD
jgi:hypothetical protein